MADAPWTRRDLVLGGVAVLLLGAVSLLTRNAGQLRPLLITVELALALACFGRALTRQAGRRASLALGAALLAWALGDIAWALESSTTTPSVADLFSLLFYPLAVVAIFVLVRSRTGTAQGERLAQCHGGQPGCSGHLLCLRVRHRRPRQWFSSLRRAQAWPIPSVTSFCSRWLSQWSSSCRGSRGAPCSSPLGGALMASAASSRCTSRRRARTATGAPLDLLGRRPWWP